MSIPFLVMAATMPWAAAQTSNWEVREDLIRDSGPDVVSGQWIVCFKRAKATRLDSFGFEFPPDGLPQGIDTMRPAELPIALDSNQRGVSYEALLPRTYVVTIPSSEHRVVRELRLRTDVRYVEPVRERTMCASWGTDNPNDTLWPNQWGVPRINPGPAWLLMGAPSNVRVGVMDTGRVDPGHPDLAANRTPNDDIDSRSTGWHATRVAGCVAATGDNGIGVAGVANVDVISIDPLARNLGFGLAVIGALDRGVDVINMSFSWIENNDPLDYAPFSQYEQDVITAASDRIIFVAAAGNDDRTADAHGDLPYPVAYLRVLGVSATDPSDLKASFSNFGTYVSFAAPGVSIATTDWFGAYVTNVDGTSYASPIAAGAISAVLAITGLGPRAVVNLLAMTAEDLGVVGKDEVFGYGLLNLGDAVEAPHTDLYVWSVGGVDYGGGTGSGSLVQPFRTLEFALNHAAPGDAIAMSQGTHHFGSISINQPVTLVGMGGGDSTILQ